LVVTERKCFVKYFVLRTYDVLRLFQALGRRIYIKTNRQQGNLILLALPLQNKESRQKKKGFFPYVGHFRPQHERDDAPLPRRPGEALFE
jgi:hypothetical protein